MKFSLYKKSNAASKRAKKPAMMFLRWVGKTPSIDWLILSFIFICLIIIVAVCSAWNFMEIKKVINVNQDMVSTAPVTASETQEEQLRELIAIYEKKKSDHANLLDEARIDSAAERRNNPAVASSTATSTPTSEATTTPAR